MNVVLRIVDTDGMETVDIDLGEAGAIPNEDDHVTFEVRPDEWVTRLVTARRGFRFERGRVVVELEASALEDDETP